METLYTQEVRRWVYALVVCSSLPLGASVPESSASLLDVNVLDCNNLTSCENFFEGLNHKAHSQENPAVQENTNISTLFERIFHKKTEHVDPLSLYLLGGQPGGHWLWKRYKDAGFKLNPLQKSVSVGHFSILFYKAYKSYFKHANFEPEVRLTFLKALYQQEYEVRKHRYTFFHAQKSNYYVPQLVFTWLLECYYDQPINKEQWWALRFKMPGTNLPYLDGVNIIQNGPDTDDRGDAISYKHFMNGPLFGNNYCQIGSSTIQYFASNQNVGVKLVQRGIADLFNIFGFDAYYQKYKAEFDAVEAAMAAKKQDYGTLLLHSFDEEALRSFVYVAKAYGWKDSLKIQGKEVDDIKLIYDTMRLNPEQFDDWEHLDMHEYVFIQTEDHPTDENLLGSLNPFNDGITTYHFTVEDMNDIKQMLADIFVKIKRDMKLETA
jgi:hypothetical protein